MTDEIEITSINTFAKATRAIAGCLYTLDLTPVNAVRGRIHDLSHNDYTEEETRALQLLCFRVDHAVREMDAHRHESPAHPHHESWGSLADRSVNLV